MKNTSRHVRAPTSKPPTNGPIAPKRPPKPAHAPMAGLRSWGRNVASMMARLAGVSSALPTPCTARARTSTRAFGAAPHTIEATVNHTRPKTKMRRRPYRSPSDPPRRRNADSVSVYAVTVHCRSASPTWKSRPMLGSATLTTLPSRKAMPEPRMVANRTQRPLALVKRRPGESSSADGTIIRSVAHSKVSAIQRPRPGRS